MDIPGYKFCCPENSKDWDPTTMLDTMSISWFYLLDQFPSKKMMNERQKKRIYLDDWYNWEKVMLEIDDGLAQVILKIKKSFPLLTEYLLWM